MNERGREASPPSFELPPTEGWEKQQEAAKEGRTGQDNPSATRPIDDASLATNSNPLSVPPVVQPGTTGASTAQPVSGDTATQSKESDRIEKIWVKKAKDIIGQTRDDPHAQKKQIDSVRAEYLKIKFNTVLKVEEAA